MKRLGLLHRGDDLIDNRHWYPVCDALGHSRSFDRAAYEAFQSLLRCFGDPELLRLKDAVTQAVRAHREPDDFSLPASRAGRTRCGQA